MTIELVGLRVVGFGWCDVMSVLLAKLLGRVFSNFQHEATTVLKLVQIRLVL